MPWSVDNRNHVCRCRFKNVPVSLKGKYDSILSIGGQWTITPCSSQYSNWAYGLDHFYFGGSWKRKTP